MKSAEKL